MSAGDREVLKAFEEVTTRNVRAAVEHSNETRNIVRVLESKIEILEGRLQQYEQRFAQIQTQLTTIQARVFSGGTV